MALVERAFGGSQRPAHFTNFEHCEECREHDDLLRSRDRATLTVKDVENPGWNPINFLTPEGFRYYFPALAKLALSPEGDAFLTDFVPFHLCDTLYDKEGRHTHRWLSALEASHRHAIREYVRFVARTKREIMEPHGAYAEELDRAVAFWDAECAAHGE